MSLLNVLRGALAVTRQRPASILSKYPAMSTVARQNATKVTPVCRNLGEIKAFQVKLFQPMVGRGGLTGTALRAFSTSQLRLSQDHAKLWVVERYFSAALLGIIPLGLLMPNVLFDILMAVSVVMHMHWGIEAIVIDYVRPIIFGPLVPKIAVMLVYALSIFTLVGLMNLTFNNKGIGKSIKLLWNA